MKCSSGLIANENVRKREVIHTKLTNSGSINYPDRNIMNKNYVVRGRDFPNRRNDLTKLIQAKAGRGDRCWLIDYFPKPRKIKKIIVASLVVSAIVFVIFAAIFLQCGRSYITDEDDDTLNPPDPESFQPPSWSKLKIFKGGAVCSDGARCADIGKSILEKNGSAVDATISTMICNGLINMQAMGMGGGFMMTIYERSKKQAYFLIARDMAPIAAHPDMYRNKSSTSSRFGPLSIAVPGEVAGYWAAHKRFGKLPWADLFKPSIELCENGWNMTRAMFDDIRENEEVVKLDDTLRNMFVDSTTKMIKKPGDLIKPDKLCATMRILAEKGAPELYNGTLGKTLIADLQKRGSILTEEDLRKYRTKWAQPLTTSLSGGIKLFTSNFPSSGALLTFVLNVFDEFKFRPDSLNGWNNTIRTYHRIIETWKFAYAVRSKMGDADYVDMTDLLYNLTSKDYAKLVRSQINDDKTFNDPAHYGAGDGLQEDHGTAQFSVLAPNGDAVAVTSSINMYFGSGITSENTGLLLNSGMDDFAVPSVISYYGLPGTNKNNLIRPGKRPLSSMVPSVLTTPDGDVRMVIGSAGGTKITTSVSYVIARHLWMNNTIKEAMDAARIHHQVFPMQVEYEYGVPKQVVEGLKARGHKTKRYRDRGSVVCGIAQINGTVFANADYRKGGDVFGTN